MERKVRITFLLRMIQNRTKAVIRMSGPKFDKAPQSQLQGGILGFLFHHGEEPVYQKDIEREFRISRATATNTLQVMEKNGLITRKSLDKDARLKRIIMTEDTRANHAKVEEHMRMMDERIVEGMSEEDIQTLTRYLTIIMENLDRLSQEYDKESEET